MIRKVAVLALIVVGVYFGKFHEGFSKSNGDWGAFGDYFGGILNPIIAACALYLIAKTYKLQKTELEETRKQLKISIEAQKKQVELAALTALLNTKLMQIDGLKTEKTTYEVEKSRLRNTLHNTDRTRVTELDTLINSLNKKITDVKNKVTTQENKIEEIIKELDK